MTRGSRDCRGFAQTMADLLPCAGKLLPAAAFCVALAAGGVARADMLVYSDTFENFPLGTDVTATNWTPAVGPVDSAFFTNYLSGVSTKTVVNYGGSHAVNMNLSVGAGIEYHGNLPTTYSNGVLKFEWDLTALSLHSGLGGLWIRFPSPTFGMQILVGYLDDGTIDTFSGNPSLATLVPIGTYQSNQTYHTSLFYDLSASSYSVYVGATPLLLNQPLPAYLNQTNLNGFGFDGNESFANSPGNTWILDNIAVSVVPEPMSLGLLGAGLLLGFGLLRRRRR